jgi:hypothetical protein
MKRGVLISTTEHLLAALYASGVDNVIVELDAIEVPILDGSSQPFIELLARAGLRRQRRRRRYLQVLRPLEVAEDGRRICIFRSAASLSFLIPALVPSRLSFACIANRLRGSWPRRARSVFWTTSNGCAPWA